MVPKINFSFFFYFYFFVSVPYILTKVKEKKSETYRWFNCKNIAILKITKIKDKVEDFLQAI